MSQALLLKYMLDIAFELRFIVREDKAQVVSIRKRWIALKDIFYKIIY